MEAQVRQIVAKISGTYGMARIVIGSAQELIQVAMSGSAHFGLFGMELLPGTDARIELQRQIDQAQRELASSSFPEDYDCPSWPSVQRLYNMAHAEAAAVDEGRAQTIDNDVKFWTTDLPQAAEEAYDTAAEVASGLLSGAGYLAIAAVAIAVLVLTRRA